MNNISIINKCYLCGEETRGSTDGKPMCEPCYEKGPEDTSVIKSNPTIEKIRESIENILRKQHDGSVVWLSDEVGEIVNDLVDLFEQSLTTYGNAVREEERERLKEWHKECEEKHKCVASDEGLDCCIDKFLSSLEKQEV